LSAGVVVEIFAKRDGWYEYSVYERKVSVIEGEDVTSMGIETTLREGHTRARGTPKDGKHERVKDNKSDAI